MSKQADLNQSRMFLCISIQKAQEAALPVKPCKHNVAFSADGLWSITSYATPSCIRIMSEGILFSLPSISRPSFGDVCQRENAGQFQFQLNEALVLGYAPSTHLLTLLSLSASNRFPHIALMHTQNSTQSAYQRAFHNTVHRICGRKEKIPPPSLFNNTTVSGMPISLAARRPFISW